MPSIPLSGTVLLLLASLGGAVAAEDYQAGSLVIEHPYAIATSGAARTGAGYLTIENKGSEPDRLLSIRADFPEVSLHRSEIDASGIARMTPLPSIEIPAGGSVTLAPRGMHVMFMGLSGPLTAGGKIPATLIFEKAGEAPISFAIIARGAGMGEDAHKMDN